LSRSRARKPAGGGGSRWQTVGIFLTLLAVAVLVGSLAAKFFGAGGDAPAPRRSAEGTRPTDVPASSERVRVEVLNASGTPGLAAQGRTLLRDRGFDVVQVGNAPTGSSPDTSVVMDRVGRMDVARRVADAARIGRVLERPDSNVYVDVTVVLGRDWQPPGAPPVGPP